jgi:class 3 adenylate cyclase
VSDPLGVGDRFAGVDEIGLEVRAGLHCGECEFVESKVAGIAVHIGARVADHAGPGEVLVSSTVKDLVAGSGIEFADAGTHKLRGVTDAWQLFTVLAAGGSSIRSPPESLELGV